MKDWKDILYEECKNDPLPDIFIIKEEEQEENKSQA